MKKIGEVYEEYNIMRNLREHQMRVAAVAWQICDSMDIEVATDTIVRACLLHDMGNIIKFQLGYFPETLEPEGIEYWSKVKEDFVAKYGVDEHHANLKISEELGASQDVLTCVDAIGFDNWENTHKEGDWGSKISAYADSRVAPWGVAGLEERLLDGKNRYIDVSSVEQEMRDVLYDSVRQIEKEIFSKCSIKPEDINDESIKPYLEKLKDFEI